MFSAAWPGGDKQVCECSSANWRLTYSARGETLGPKLPLRRSTANVGSEPILQDFRFAANVGCQKEAKNFNKLLGLERGFS